MKRTAKNKNLFRILAVSLLAALWVTIPFILNDKTVSADELSDTRIQASLSGGAINGVTPAGFSEWRLDDSGRRRLEVQASSVNLPNGTVLTIVVNNAAVGQMTVNSFGGAFFNIDTNDGQTVPVINFGNPIQVNNGADIILTGTYGAVTPTPSPSGSPSASPSPSVSPSASPTGSPNASPSPSPSASPGVSPSPTASPNNTPSPSPSASPTASPNPSPTASPSPGASPSPSPNGGDLFAGLSGSTLNGVLPTGFAQYEFHSSRVELEVQVYQVNLPIGTPLAVTVNGAAVGQIILESGGQGRLRLRSDRGQNVPVVTSGSTITIQNAGATVLSGTFAGATGSPSPSVSPTGSPNPSPSPTASPNETPSPSPSPSASPSPSPALGRYFEVHPTGSRLSPPVSTAANGEFKIFLSPDETQATLMGEFHNLSSAQTSAKITATIGEGAVIHDFGTTGGTNGNFASVTIPVSAIQVQQLRAGLWFVTLASAGNPAGELGGAFSQHSHAGDFDGDGNNDFAVFRPSSGTWYSENSDGFRWLNFGGSNDTPVSADYDGDGKTDPAVFKNVNGYAVWEISRSSDGGVTGVQFGLADDKPVRGDFDGDGRNDLAVFRPSTGVWYVQNSNNTGYQIVQWGLAEDVPLANDMDGDGKADFTVWRPSSGVWFWINSSTGSYGIVQFGLTGDIPLKGDFDGDGRDDVAVYRPSNGVWWIWRSSDRTYDVRQFGLSEDIPVPGNYDGDNKTDHAVFRPSTGDWWIWKSADNSYEFRHFGLTGDIPTAR